MAGARHRLSCAVRSSEHPDACSSICTGCTSGSSSSELALTAIGLSSGRSRPRPWSCAGASASPPGAARRGAAARARCHRGARRPRLPGPARAAARAGARHRARPLPGARRRGPIERGGLDKSTSRRGSQVWRLPPERPRYRPEAATRCGSRCRDDGRDIAARPPSARPIRATRALHEKSVRSSEAQEEAPRRCRQSCARRPCTGQARRADLLPLWRRDRSSRAAQQQRAAQRRAPRPARRGRRYALATSSWRTAAATATTAGSTRTSRPA